MRARAAAARLGAPGLAALGVLLVVAGACLVGPVLSPHSAGAADLGARDQGPSWSHPFGTGSLGEDVLTRVMVAGRASLAIGFGAALATTALGAALGLLAGWRGGWVDEVAGRVTELVLAVPAFVLLIVLSLSFAHVGLPEVILILAALGWPPLFRLTRATVLSANGLAYVEAARAAGAGGARIALRHLLPAAVPEIAAFASLAVGAAILAESALSFLSLGIDPDTELSWGTMLIGAPDTVEDRPWLTVFPGLAIVVTVLASALLADAVRAALDPRGARRAAAASRLVP